MKITRLLTVLAVCPGLALIGANRSAGQQQEPPPHVRIVRVVYRLHLDYIEDSSPQERVWVLEGPPAHGFPSVTLWHTLSSPKLRRWVAKLDDDAQILYLRNGAEAINHQGEILPPYGPDLTAFRRFCDSLSVNFMDAPVQ